jgi:hypothetical protein
MTKGVWGDIVQMAWDKRTPREKFWYLCKGLMFLPFLLSEQKEFAGAGDNDATGQSSAGDDVYPLF